MHGRDTVMVGIIGTGYIARGLSYIMRNDNDFSISKVLSRRNPDEINGLAVDRKDITNSVQELIDCSDIIVECSGDPVYATEVLTKVMEEDIPVVTMDSDLQVTTGSWLLRKGFITEAEGDQPGSTAALYEDVVSMGFKPLVFGNIKGYLKHQPTKEEMQYWSKRHGISLEQVTAFTDGTKLQIEQTLTANFFKTDILCQGMVGVECVNYMDGAFQLANMAEEYGSDVTDYVLSPKSPAGVFIVAAHDEVQAPYLRHFKLGDGPYYVLTKPFHVCHMEIPKTIRRVLKGEGVLLNNTENPRISVATVAKRKFASGEIIERGIGSFSVRGEAINIADHKNHLPIGLAFNTEIKRNIEPGQIITFDDVEIPETMALSAWKETIGTLNN